MLSNASAHVHIEADGACTSPGEETRDRLESQVGRTDSAHGVDPGGLPVRHGRCDADREDSASSAAYWAGLGFDWQDARAVRVNASWPEFIDVDREYLLLQ